MLIFLTKPTAIALKCKIIAKVFLGHVEILNSDGTIRNKILQIRKYYFNFRESNSTLGRTFELLMIKEVHQKNLHLTFLSLLVLQKNASHLSDE